MPTKCVQNNHLHLISINFLLQVSGTFNLFISIENCCLTVCKTKHRQIKKIKFILEVCFLLQNRK